MMELSGYDSTIKLGVIDVIKLSSIVKFDLGINDGTKLGSDDGIKDGIKLGSDDIIELGIKDDLKLGSNGSYKQLQ